MKPARPLEVNWLVTLVVFFIFMALFGLFIYELRDILTPMILVVGMLFLLAPLRNNMIIRRVIILIAFIALYFLYQEARSIIIPVLASMLLAYVFDPLIDYFETKGIKRERSILWLIMGLIFLLGLAIVFLIPILIEEIQKFFKMIPTIRTHIMEWVDVVQAKLIEYGLISEEKFLDEKILAGAQNVIEAVVAAALKFTKAAGNTISHVLNIILIPFLTYYFLVDFDRIRDGILTLIPLEQQAKIREIMENGDRMVGLYLRGQLSVCFIIGVLTTLLLTVLGVDYALLLGTMAGIANLIPYVGLTVTLIVAATLMLFGPDPIVSLLKVGGAFWLVQFLEGTFISPKIVGNVTGLHPATVMIALLLFANFFGFLGLLIAVPVTAVGKVLLMEWYENYKKSDFYQDADQLVEG